jgi:cysteinyl-tRNA synthetase
MQRGNPISEKRGSAKPELGERNRPPNFASAAMRIIRCKIGDSAIGGGTAMKWRIWFVLLLILTVQACGSAEDEAPVEVGEPPASEPQPEPLAPLQPPIRPNAQSVVDKWELWTSGTQLRGADLHPCKVLDEDECLEPTRAQDVLDLADLGANLINASYPGVYAVEAPYGLDALALADLDNLIEWSDQVGIYVVIHFRTGPGRSESAIHQQRGADMSIWTDPQAQDAWIEMWRMVAERYRESPVVVGYNLLVEPLANLTVDPDQELDPKSVQAELEGTLADWNVLARRITAAIREVDEETPIIIDSISWANAAWFSVLEPTGDDRTVYSLHTYDPDAYTTQEEGDDSISYPDVVEDYGETIEFNRQWLEQNLRPALEFSEEHQVPIYVGEFGAMRWVPNADGFVRDQISLFEEYGWNYAYYVWRGDDAYFDGFNMELGSDPSNHELVTGNEMLQLHIERWSENTFFPSTDSGPAATALGVADVAHWLYLIDVNLEEAIVDRITDSSYDMVVVDYIPSEANNVDYPMAEVVEAWHNAAHPKLVIAYIDIGEAEDYRTYWQPDWGIGNPEWIAGSDPDGWEGNFPVAYWYDEWQEIWLGAGGLMEGILSAGFDGIYLDWIEAYSDESVLAIAQQDGVDPVQEMVWWVEALGDFGRGHKQSFIVIGQNAAELAERGDYINVIDAIAQEQIWFDGGADNDPPGDCPLPRTEVEVDTDAYRDALSTDCRRQFDEFPESTLHVSSEGYIEDLLVAQSAGLTIFTIDYALDPENIDWVYQTSRGLGFIPFVSNRSLDQFVDPYP